MLEPRRSFALGVLNGALFNFAFVFIAPNTILALFVATATGSEALVGLAVATVSLCRIIPQAFVAGRIRGAPRKMAYYHISFALRGPALLSMILFVSIAGSSPVTSTFLVLFSFAWFFFGAGFASVPFMEILGNVLPPSQRSSFFALRNFTGLLLGILGGFTIRFVLASPERYPFPTNYMIFFGIGALFAILSMVSFSIVREPPSNGVREVLTIGETLRKAREILSVDPAFARYMGVRLLIAATSIAAPFYLIHATKSLNFGEGAAGILIMSITVGGVVSNLVWGRIGDIKGTKIMILTGAFLLTVVPLTALISRMFPNLLLSTITFLILGMANAGTAIGVTNYLLDHCDNDSRSVCVATANILAGLAAVAPIAGGLVVTYLGYTSLFMIALAIAASAALVALKLPEPREGAEKRFQVMTRSA